MARTKKKKRFSATKAIKALARERVGAPPVTRSVPHIKKSKAPKHKPTLGKLLADE